MQKMILSFECKVLLAPQVNLFCQLGDETVIDFEIHFLPLVRRPIYDYLRDGLRYRDGKKRHSHLDDGLHILNCAHRLDNSRNLGGIRNNHRSRYRNKV